MDLWIFPETNVFASLTFLIASTQFRFLEGELELVYDARRTVARIPICIATERRRQISQTERRTPLATGFMFAHSNPASRLFKNQINEI